MSDILNIVKAHAYLYYVLGESVITDQEYDRMYRESGADFIGSDLESDYSEEVKQIASQL